MGSVNSWVKVLPILVFIWNVIYNNISEGTKVHYPKAVQSYSPLPSYDSFSRVASLFIRSVSCPMISATYSVTTDWSLSLSPEVRSGASPWRPQSITFSTTSIPLTTSSPSPGSWYSWPHCSTSDSAFCLLPSSSHFSHQSLVHVHMLIRQRLITNYYSLLLETNATY